MTWIVSEDFSSAWLDVAVAAADGDGVGEAGAATVVSTDVVSGLGEGDISSLGDTGGIDPAWNIEKEM